MCGSLYILSSTADLPSALPPIRQHPMVLHPRQPKIANISSVSASSPPVSTSRVMSPSALEPLSFKEANQYLCWHTAMKDEIVALHANATWSLVPFDPSMNIVGCRWVYKIKRRADGAIDQYKARLVARGFTQHEGIDYSETLSPVVKPTTVRLILTIAVSKGWQIRQLDVHNAFLNGSLREVVYMQQPPGFVNTALPTHVCRLHKSLYGLKQAPRAWYMQLSDFLMTIGFRASKVDTSLFILNGTHDICYLLVYVDDIIITGNNSELIHRLITLLNLEFKLRNLGYARYFLGIEVSPTSMGLVLSQHKYVLDILNRAGMSLCKPVDTPSSVSKLDLQSIELFSDTTHFRQIIGALQYLTFTRPDICYAVNKVCQFMHAPTEGHWAAVKLILRYLKGTSSFGLHLTRDSALSLHGFTDADWADSIDDRKSTGGYIVFLGTTPIS